MRVIIASSTDIEKACRDFESLLTGTHYYSDDCDESSEVDYTVTIAPNVVDAWIARSRTSGLVDETTRIVEV